MGHGDKRPPPLFFYGHIGFEGEMSKPEKETQILFMDCHVEF
jgi:hypothetical protein